MVAQQHKLVVVDLLLEQMVLVLLVYLLLVLVVLMHLVVVQTKNKTDTTHLTLMVKELVLAQQSGLKHLHIQMQYILEVLVFLILHMDLAVLVLVIMVVVLVLMLVVIHTFRTGDIRLGLVRGAVTWMPLLAVVAWVYGIMGFTGFQLNSQTVTIGALTLGLGVDYAVHISTRIEEEVEKNPPFKAAAAEAAPLAPDGAPGGARPPQR